MKKQYLYIVLLAIIGSLSLFAAHEKQLLFKQKLSQIAAQKVQQIHQGKTIEQVKEELGTQLSSNSKEWLIKEIARNYYLEYGVYLDVGYDYGFSVRELIDANRIAVKGETGTLNLSNLRITSLDGMERVASKEFVTNLNLSNNQLTFLPDPAFPGFGRLERLIISHNKIVEIADRAFDGLVSLEYLDLSYNKLTDRAFSDLLLSTLTDLWNLNLAGNNISSKKQKQIRGVLKGISVGFSRPKRNK